MQVSRREGGFTLLEVLVAFAIAAPALMLLYRQAGLSSGMTRTALSYEEAVSRARSHLDAMTDAALTPGERQGDDGGGFHWRTRIAPLGTLPPPRTAGPGRPGPYRGGTALYAVVVELTWPGTGGPRNVTLESRRLGPALAALP